jgi:hypothetical protein
MTNDTIVPPSPGLLRMMATAILAGIIAAIVTTLALMALLGGWPSSGADTQSGLPDSRTLLLAAFLWYLPAGIVVFAPLARLSGIAADTGALRFVKLLALAILLWLAVGEAAYLLLGPDTALPRSVQRNDLIGAALSGTPFAIAFDLLLRRRDALLRR